jgi:hypothetical protein
LSEAFLLLTTHAYLPMPAPLPTSEPSDDGNRDRHAGTDATGNPRTSLLPENVPTRDPARRSAFHRIPRKRRVVEGGREPVIYKQFLYANPLRSPFADFI